jgi:hypothetical protein
MPKVRILSQFRTAFGWDVGERNAFRGRTLFKLAGPFFLGFLRSIDLEPIGMGS